MGISSKTFSSVQAQPKPFPKLMSGKTSGVVVLFTGPKHGTVVMPGSVHDIGHQSQSWDMTCFTDYEGTVSLSNE